MFIKKQGKNLRSIKTFSAALVSANIDRRTRNEDFGLPTNSSAWAITAYAHSYAQGSFFRQKLARDGQTAHAAA
jgi:hypothetical protein